MEEKVASPDRDRNRNRVAGCYRDLLLSRQSGTAFGAGDGRVGQRRWRYAKRSLEVIGECRPYQSQKTRFMCGVDPLQLHDKRKLEELGTIYLT